LPLLLWVVVAVVVGGLVLVGVQAVAGALVAHCLMLMRKVLRRALLTRLLLVLPEVLPVEIILRVVQGVHQHLAFLVPHTLARVAVLGA
jgi:hypothetical protein